MLFLVQANGWRRSFQPVMTAQISLLNLAIESAREGLPAYGTCEDSGRGAIQNW